MKNFFEIINIVEQKLVKKFTKLLKKCDLKKKFVACVKDEGFIFIIMTTSLKFVISCGILGLEESL